MENLSVAVAQHPHGHFLLNLIKIVLFIVAAFILVMHFTLYANYNTN